MDRDVITCHRKPREFTRYLRNNAHAIREIIRGNMLASMMHARSLCVRNGMIILCLARICILIAQIICINEPRKYILSKYCKLNIATIEACINCTKFHAGEIRLEYSGIFARLALLFTRLTLRYALHVSRRANEQYASLWSPFLFALRRTCSILAHYISYLIEMLAANTAMYNHVKEHQ